MNIFETVDKSKLNLHYWNRYVKFINEIWKKGRRKLYYKENHHIIPKCIDDSLYKDKNNIIILTAREHYIAHKILSYCYFPNTEEYNKLIFALFAMSKLKMKTHKRDNVINSREYELLRIRYSEARRSYMKDHINDEKYIALKGKNKPSPNRGMICITNGVCNKYICKNDTVPEGWYKGCTQTKHDDNWRQSLKDSWKKNKINRTGKNHPMYGKGYLLKGKPGTITGKIGINKNGINKYINKVELNNYIKDGWNLGINKRTISKNNGIYIYKDQKCILIDKKNLQIYISQGWVKGNPRAGHPGTKNPSYGKICVNKNGITKRVLPDELNSYLNNGWTKGMASRNNLKGN